MTNERREQLREAITTASSYSELHSKTDGNPAWEGFRALDAELRTLYIAKKKSFPSTDIRDVVGIGSMELPAPCLPYTFAHGDGSDKEQA